jgi:hypothetical protein
MPGMPNAGPSLDAKGLAGWRKKSSLRGRIVVYT